jgi:hypothetical protein
MLKATWVWTVGCALLLAACGHGEEQAEDIGRQAGTLTRCESASGVAFYDFAELSARLAKSSVLQNALELKQVASCVDARRFLEADYQARELGPSADSLASSLPRDAEPGDIGAGLGVVKKAIKGANAAHVTQRGFVQIGNCGGVVILQRAILTTASCVAHLAPLSGVKNFDAVVKLERYIPFTSFGTTYSIRQTVYQGWARINIHPGYGGSSDAGDDLAVVKRYSSSFGFATNERTRIYTGLGSVIGAMRLVGRGGNSATTGGAGQNILRRMTFDPDWWGPHHFLMDARGSRTCSGDKGSPILDFTPSHGHRVVAGLLSHWQGSIGYNLCAAWGKKMRAVRLQRKIAFIEDMLDVDCREFNDSGWAYVKCFQ